MRLFFRGKPKKPQPPPPEPVVTLALVMRQIQVLNLKVENMSEVVDALTPKIDALVDLVHQLAVKIGTPPVVSPEDAAALASDGGKLDAAIALATSVLNPPAPVPVEPAPAEPAV
jgi:hypothetical protein